MNALPLEATTPFESMEGNGDDVHRTLSKDYHEGEGVLINSGSILRMHAENRGCMV